MNVVEQIFDAVKALAQTTFGADYLPLRKITDPEQNDARIAAKGFAVKHGESTFAEGVTRVYTMNQEFRVLITNAAANRDDENSVQAVFNNLYNLADAFLNAAFLTKLGLGSIILIVDQPKLSEPVLMKNDAALLILSFNIKYRRAIA